MSGIILLLVIAGVPALLVYLISGARSQNTSHAPMETPQSLALLDNDDDDSGLPPIESIAAYVSGRTADDLPGEPEDDSEPWGVTFGEHCETPPVGWARVTEALEVAGLEYREEATETFVTGVARAEKLGFPYGLSLEPDPQNEHDRHAIKVNGWIKVNNETFLWHLGFVPRRQAEWLTQDYLNRHIALTAWLDHIFRSHDDTQTEIVFCIMARDKTVGHP